MDFGLEERTALENSLVNNVADSIDQSNPIRFLKHCSYHGKSNICLVRTFALIDFFFNFKSSLLLR